METLKTKIITFINTYKWLLVPIIPMVFFLGLIIYLSLPKTSSEQPPLVTPSPRNTRLPSATVTASKPRPTMFQIPSARFDAYETERETPISSLPGYQKAETLPNGFTKHTVTSANPSRPDVHITQGEITILERKIVPARLGIKINHFTGSYGQPQGKLIGSPFYGQNAEVYIYADIGTAFIADPQTQNVLETHLFPPMSVNDYINYIRVYE